jgi:hypothetical protein
MAKKVSRKNGRPAKIGMIAATKMFKTSAVGRMTVAASPNKVMVAI